MVSMVENAVAADAPALGAMHINAFETDQPEPLFVEPYAVAGWGGFIRDAADAAAAAAAAGDAIRAGPQTRVGVIRDESGTAKAACLLRIAPDKNAVAGLYADWEDLWGTPLPGMSRDRMDAFFGGMKAQHKTVMGDTPHIYLEIVMAHSSARGRGYGMALLQFANTVADGMGLPLYLDSNKDVTALYERLGYVKQPDEVRTSNCLIPMLRPVKM
ncbi:hypothetical protein V2A60_002693 [Cordyceps javanica]|uniref:Acyl-CoA N-acyltransferase n=1 Tax=Cordyceps javanica TaxID=43265 RepID=A0A545VWP2_9HYPO|nr:Acyl-CoA N-acyltransferase [Cordyceps javanica]TQW06139.1 Acyl-CoA N-acyltransferase [Cordyceps javanica]